MGDANVCPLEKDAADIPCYKVVRRKRGIPDDLPLPGCTQWERDEWQEMSSRLELEDAFERQIGGAQKNRRSRR